MNILDNLKPKKTFLIFTGYLSDADNGPHTTLRAFIEIIEKIYDVVIIGFSNSDRSDFTKYWRIGNAKVIFLKNYLGGHYYFNLLVFIKIIMFFQRTEFFFFNGIWYSYLPILSSVLKFYNKKYVICPHGGLNKEEDISIFKKIYYKFFIGFILKNSYFIQISSPLELKLIRQNKYLKFKNFKYKLLPNTINNIKIKNAKKNFNYSIKNYAFFIGRIHPIKDLEFLLNAWNYFTKKFISNNYMLLIAGQGEEVYTKKLKNIINQKKIKNVKFLGKINHTDKLNLIKNAKFTTITSHTEALPTTIIESLALSTPVLSTIKLGLKKNLINESVIHVDKNLEKFANKIFKIFNLHDEEYKYLENKSKISYNLYFSNKAITKLVKEYYMMD